MTIHGLKWTPRPAGMHHQRCHRRRGSPETSTFDPRIAACMGGGGWGRAAPMSGLRCRQASSLTQAPTWSRRMSASARTAGSRAQTTRILDGRGSCGAGTMPGSLAAPDSSSTGLVVHPETLPNELQNMPWWSGVHHLRVGCIPALALGPNHALQGRARHRKIGLRAAESLQQGRHYGFALLHPWTCTSAVTC